MLLRSQRTVDDRLWKLDYASNRPVEQRRDCAHGGYMRENGSDAMADDDEDRTVQRPPGMLTPIRPAASSATPVPPPAAPAPPVAVPPVASAPVMSLEYEPNVTLGCGAYGVVRRGVLRKPDGSSCLVARKEFLNEDEEEEEAEELNAAVVREVCALCSLPPHPCVLRPKAVLRHDGSASKLLILSPLHAGNLRACMQTIPRMSEPMLQACAVQLLHGIAHMHRHGFVHRDLKLENVLVASDGRLVLCDFGMARHMAHRPLPSTPPSSSLHDPRSHTHTTSTCTLWTRAPELCLLAKHHTAAIDVWSVGAILLACAARGYAFRGADPRDMLQLLWKLVGQPPEHATVPWADTANTPLGAFPPYRSAADRAARVQRVRDITCYPSLSEGFADFVCDALLEPVPERRLTAEAALAHPYLAGISLAEAVVRCYAPATFSAAPLGLRHATTTVALEPRHVLWTDDGVDGVDGRADGGVDDVAAAAAPLVVEAADTRTRSQRVLVCNWLWDASNILKCRPSVFFDVVQLFDRVARVGHDLHLVGVACHSLITLMDETCPPNAHDYTVVCCNKYSRSQLADAQLNVLRAARGRLFADDRLYTHLARLCGPDEVPPFVLQCAAFLHMSPVQMRSMQPLAGAAIILSARLTDELGDDAVPLPAVVRAAAAAPVERAQHYYDVFTGWVHDNPQITTAKKKMAPFRHLQDTRAFRTVCSLPEPEPELESASLPPAPPS